MDPALRRKGLGTRALIRNAPWEEARRAEGNADAAAGICQGHLHRVARLSGIGMGPGHIEDARRWG